MQGTSEGGADVRKEGGERGSWSICSMNTMMGGNFPDTMTSSPIPVGSNFVLILSNHKE